MFSSTSNLSFFQLFMAGMERDCLFLEASDGEETKFNGEESPEMGLLPFLQCGMTDDEVALRYKS